MHDRKVSSSKTANAPVSSRIIDRLAARPLDILYPCDYTKRREITYISLWTKWVESNARRKQEREDVSVSLSPRYD